MIDAEKIKLVVTDIDGTLYSHTQDCVPESAVNAIRKLHEKGIAFALCSGRNRYLIGKSGVLNYVNPDAMITMNGATVYVGDKVIHSYPIPPDVVNSLIKFSKRLKFGLTLIELNEGHINYIDDRVISAHEKYGTRFPQPRTFPDNYDRVVYQAICYCDALDESLFLPHIKGAKSARWDQYAVDIMPEGSDKSKGLLALLDYLHLKPENAIAFGDGNNDIEVLQFAGVGVAMGNAVDGCKEAADYITDDIDKDGWAKALINLGIIKDDNHTIIKQ
jgi:Cof subfamily protein (haloacid dehalogenase superfamily)